MSLLNANVSTHSSATGDFAFAQSHIKDPPCSAVLEAWSFVRRVSASKEDYSSTEKSKRSQILAVASVSSTQLNVLSRNPP